MSESDKWMLRILGTIAAAFMIWTALMIAVALEYGLK